MNIMYQIIVIELYHRSEEYSIVEGEGARAQRHPVFIAFYNNWLHRNNCLKKERIQSWLTEEVHQEWK